MTAYLGALCPFGKAYTPSLICFYLSNILQNLYIFFSSFYTLACTLVVYFIKLLRLLTLIPNIQFELHFMYEKRYINKGYYINTDQRDALPVSVYRSAPPLYTTSSMDGQSSAGGARGPGGDGEPGGA